MEVLVRRSTQDDVFDIRTLATDDGFILEKRYKAPVDGVAQLIEASYLAVTLFTQADDGAETIVGFAAFSDAPPDASGLSRSRWEHELQEGFNVDDLRPASATWLTFFVAAKDVEADALDKTLTTAFATLPHAHTVLFALSEDVPPFSPVCDVMTPVSDDLGAAGDFRGLVWEALRKSTIPELVLRPGVVEDYDDLMPLLLAGDGTVTPLPEDLYLEERLQSQDESNAVVVAQCGTTGAVVGVMCLCASQDEQQHVARQYHTDIFNRLKPSGAKGAQGRGHVNAVHITFFFLKPEYDTRAWQFVPHVFSLFSQAEYCFTFLPHAQALHPVLHDFLYLPPKKVQPSTLQGERVPLPEGLYLAARRTLQAVAVEPVTPEHEAAVAALLQTQTELSQDAADEIVAEVAAAATAATEHSDGNGPVPTAFVLTAEGGAVVGVAVTRLCSVDDMYALRANFALDKFVNFTPSGKVNYKAVEIEEDPYVAPTTYRTNAAPGVMLQGCFAAAAFRPRIRFLVREVLRLTRSEVLLHAAGAQAEVFAPLLAELVLTPPRRVMEFATPEPEAPGVPELRSMGPDEESLWALHCTTRRLLSDEKTQINARVVVVGPGSTGLAALYSLLQVPYLHFSNLVLVAPDGLPEHPLQKDRVWVADAMEWTEREYLALQVGKSVRVVEGTMVDFDRTDKYIYTDSATCEPYDHLILTVGRQYTIPKELLRQSGARNGVFALTHSTTAQIRQHITETEVYEDDRTRAVLYGGGLDVLAIAASIIDLGIGPQRICIVSPQPADHTPLDDQCVADAVQEMLEAMGVQQYKAHRLDRLEYDEDNSLRCVVIAPADVRGVASTAQAAAMAASKQLEIDATMLVYADEKDIDTQVLSALNKRSIVFDGRVIVEDCFRTTDPCIFAAGPVAMFSRRFGPYADFDEFSPVEVGRCLAHTILGFLNVDEFVTDATRDDERAYAPKDDPLAAQLGTQFREQPPDDLARRRPKPLPKFADHLCRRVTLPGGQTFFTCESLEYRGVKERCTVLSSYSQEHPGPGAEAVPEGAQSYLRVSVGPTRRVESVLFFGHDTRELYGIRSLVGMPESTLNLVYEFNETRDEHGNPGGLELQQFLRQHWARAVFHDQYREVAEQIKRRWLQRDDVAEVKEDLLRAVRESGTADVPEEARVAALAKLASLQSEARHAVELEMIKFMHHHKAFAPQRYYLPDATFM